MKFSGRYSSLKFRCIHRNFTLVELLTAMAVLSILMLMLFQFFSSAQRAWSATETNTRIYENARIVLEVITRDLQSAVAQHQRDALVPFYVWSNSVNLDRERTEPRHLSFISRVEGPIAANADLAEICYWWTNNTSAASDQYLFRRSRVCDDEGDWDFFGKTDTSWTVTDGTFQKVIPGVASISFTCFGWSVTPGDSGPSGSPVLLTDSNTPTFTLPAAVTVSLTLFDDKLMSIAQGRTPDQLQNDNRINKSLRTFTKMIYLNSSN